MDLIHQLLQLMLTCVGYPPEEVYPRIDLFSYCSIALAHLSAAIAFLYAFRSVSSALARAAVAFVVLIPFFDVPISGYNVILEPDYLMWITPLMLVTSAAVFRAISDGFRKWDQRDSWIFAGLIAASLGLKATLLIYPLSLGVILIVSRKEFQASLVQAITAAVLGILGWLVVLLVYYHGHWDDLVRYFNEEARFGSSVRPNILYFTWIRDEMLSGPWIVKASVILPIAAICMLALTRSRQRFGLILGVLAGGTIYHCFLFFRNTPVTWFETANFLTFSVIVGSYASILRSESAGRRITLSLVGLMAAVSVFYGIVYMHQHYIPYLTELNKAQSRAAVALAGYQDRIAFLLPDNSYRPFTIDSAVFKGGSNILEGATFGKSKLIRSMFPNRWYFTEPPAHYVTSPIDLRPYLAVVFVIRKGMDPEAGGQLAAMIAHYGPALSRLTLRNNIDFGSQEFLVWAVEDHKEPK